jgi:hypothetical protein
LRNKKKRNKAEWPETEILVEECLRAHQDEVEAFTHFTLKSKDNSRGRDFWIRLRGFPDPIYLQVKTSDNTETKGYLLPLPEPLPPNFKISVRTLDIINRHSKKHPDVPCIIFVGKAVRGKRKEEILEDIWRELVNIFRELLKNKEKSTMKEVD